MNNIKGTLLYRLSIGINAAFYPASSATQQCWRIACILIVKRAFQHMTLREIQIQKSLDLVSHNPGISGLKNGLGFGIAGLQSLHVTSALHCLPHIIAWLANCQSHMCGGECHLWSYHNWAVYDARCHISDYSFCPTHHTTTPATLSVVTDATSAHQSDVINMQAAITHRQWLSIR